LGLVDDEDNAAVIIKIDIQLDKLLQKLKGMPIFKTKCIANYAHNTSTYQQLTYPLKINEPPLILTARMFTLENRTIIVHDASYFNYRLVSR